MARRKSEAWDVKLTAAEREQLADDLCRDIQDALDMRQATIAPGGRLDLNHWYYEQGQSVPEERALKGGADLTSFIITENVDAMRSRLDKAMWVEPFCIVDGWGADASKAPQVEAFHEWQVEEENLRGELVRAFHGALLSDLFVLEVRERIETRRITEEIDVALALVDGMPVFADGKPNLLMDADGEPVPAHEGQPSAKVKRTYTKTKRLGPEYERISARDFVYLPGHAKTERQCYGYAYRFHARIAELQERAQDKIYDEAAVETLGEESDRIGDHVPRPVDGIQHQLGPAREKELWQCSIKRDLDGDGREEWYLVTLSLQSRVILRCKLDLFVQKVGMPRCVPIVLCPREDSVYGYSYAEKLLTLAEEHTALRNMAADRSALATNKPLTQISGGLWDPDAQPLGVGVVIPVRSHDEVKELNIQDVPQSVIYMLRDIMQAKERVGGLADTAIGVQSAQGRTLGENQMIAGASAVRVDEILGHVRRSISHIMLLRHQIWLDSMDESKGMDAPGEVVSRLMGAGVDVQGGQFTKAMLTGRFRFKPYGSVDTADANIRMQYFNQGLITLGNISQMFPAMKGIFGDPEVALRVLKEWARVYKVRDVNVFLKALQRMQMQPPVPLPMAGGMGAGDPIAAGASGMPPPLQQLMAMAGGAHGPVN